MSKADRDRQALLQRLAREQRRVLDAAARDAYSRLIHPSLENELRSELSDAAAEGAIKVFGDNLR